MNHSATTEEAIAQVQDGIRQAVRPFAGRANTADAQDALAFAVMSFLESKPQIQAVDRPIVKKAWDKMTWKDKVKWWTINSLFPVIGKTLRGYHASLQMSADTEHRRFRYSLYDSRDVFVPPLPLWALEDPHGTVIVDYWFRPVQPIERFTFKGTLDRSGVMKPFSVNPDSNEP